MTFRKITFIFIALLLSSLFLLQFWLIQNFTKDVSSKIGEAAFEVSRSTIETLMFRQPDIQFKSFAISSHISVTEQIKILNTMSGISDHVNITLIDGQKDKFLTINSSGSNYKVSIPRTGIDKSLEEMSNKILMSALAFIIIGLLAASYFARRLSQPLKDLQTASDQVGRGDFGFQVESHKKYQSIEIRNTITAFNEMSNKIDRLQKENEILQKQAHLSELTEITRGLAHTIRNPLNTLNLAIDQLSTSDNKASKLEMVKISKHQVQRIDEWVRSLMDIMSSDTNLVETINVEKLLHSCIEDLSNSNNSVVKIQLDKISPKPGEDALFHLKAIRPELKSLLQSLISNSIEATEAIDLKDSSEEMNTVSITLCQEKNSIRITITDHGIGFNKEIKSKLFSPHNTNKTYGAGMGLYLAHRIITLKYDGNLEITDNPELTNDEKTGAKITITLNNRV